MASKGGNALTRRVSFVYLQKLFAGVSLIAFLVVSAAGVMAEVGVMTITFRALIVILAVSIVSRLLIRVLATYEEMK